MIGPGNWDVGNRTTADVGSKVTRVTILSDVGSVSEIKVSSILCEIVVGVDSVSSCVVVSETAGEVELRYRRMMR